MTREERLEVFNMAAKKSGSSQRRGSDFKRFLFLLFLVTCSTGLFWSYHHVEQLQNVIMSPDRDESIETFETAYLPEDILAKHSDLLPTKQHSFGPVTLFFSPHLLVQGKYSPDGRSSQLASMLWDLTNGELVLDTNGFDHTQGFSDCLMSQANADDFRILHTLTKKGPLSKEAVVEELGIDDAIICDRIESLRKRHLVIVANDIVRLHVESPLLKVKPLTAITRPFVNRHSTHGSLISPTYSKGDIETLVKAAFGPDLAIRSSRIIYIPTYEVQINNPDGSLRKTYWNGLSSKEMWKGSKGP
jgi:hypothetical protein